MSVQAQVHQLAAYRGIPAGGTLLDSWAVYMRAAGLRPRSVHERVQLIERTSARTGAQPHKMTADDLVNYLASPMGAGTRQTYYSALRTWHRWLVLHGHRTDDPTLLLPAPKVPRHQKQPIATEHLQVLLATRMRSRTRMLILLCAYQGLRVSEAASIRGEHVDLVAHRLRVLGKGGVDAVIPLSPVIRELAPKWPRKGWWFPAYGPNVDRPDGGGPVLARSASTVVSDVMRRADVPGTAHSLRHWHATTLLQEGADVRTVQTILRHASLATTQLYLHVDTRQQSQAIALLPDARPGASTPEKAS